MIHIKLYKINIKYKIKLSKIQLNKIGQSRGFLGRLLLPLLKTGLPLMKNILKTLAKTILIPLGLTAAASTDADIHKKMYESGVTKLIISNGEINDIMKQLRHLKNLVY